MARPRTIKLFGGEIIIRNLPKDKQDAIAEMLLEYESLNVSNPAEESLAPAEESLEHIDLFPEHKDADSLCSSEDDYLTGKALGLQFSGGTFKLVDVSYNLHTLKARVNEVRDVGNSTAVAQSDFRNKASKLFNG